MSPDFSFKLIRVTILKIAGFGVEEWLNVWEKSATCDIAQVQFPQ